MSPSLFSLSLWAPPLSLPSPLNLAISGKTGTDVDVCG